MFRIQLPNFKKLFDEYFVINLQITGHKFSISDARAHLIQTFLGHNRSFRKHAGNGPRKHNHSKPLVFLLRVRANSTFFSQLTICEHLYYYEQRSQNGRAALRAVAIAAGRGAVGRLPEHFPVVGRVDHHASILPTSGGSMLGLSLIHI